MADTLEFGSLYLDNKPVAPEAKYQSGQAISFGETLPDMAISWVPVNGMLIADRCLLTNISWDDLDTQDLVFGKEITLCGFKFRARLLKVGCDEDAFNEWDAALDTVGEDDALWHWGGPHFWGQESVSGAAAYRAVRGYLSARYYNWDTSSHRDADYGFRPVLELLPTDLFDIRPNQKILVIVHNGCVMGTLMEKTQYDLILCPKAGGGNWSAFVCYKYAGWYTGC